MSRWLDARLSLLKAREGYRFAVDPKVKTVRIKLDANENWHIPVEKLRGVIRKALEEVDVRRYPVDAVQDLRTAVSKHFLLPEECLVPTQGTDQAIDLLCRGFLRPGDRALIVGPTFSFYRLRAAFSDAKCAEITMNEDFTLPVGRILEEAASGGIVFLCSPNNPTGNQFSPDDVLRLTEAFQGLVVLDEAYVDFAPHSLVKEIMQPRNLAVLRTFSKAFGLADLRLGFIAAHPDWASLFMERVQYPYPISSTAAAIALRLLQQFSLVKRGLQSLKRERNWLLQQLKQIVGVQVLNSQANFVLASLPTDAEKVHAELLNRGIATRNIGRVLNLFNCLRITVGTREMNSAFLDALMRVLFYA